MTYLEMIEEAIEDELRLIDRIPYNPRIPSNKFDVERQKALVRLMLLQEEKEKFYGN